VSARTFVVTVSDSPQRVVVEDVRSRRTAIGDDLANVGHQIADLLAQPPKAARRGSDDDADPVSGA